MAADPTTAERAHAQHEQARLLAEEIVSDLELNQLPLSGIAMKAARLARMVGDDRAQRWLLLEVSGYPAGMDQEAFDLGVAAGRRAEDSDAARTIWVEALAPLESRVEALRTELSNLRVPPLTEGSTRNPYVFPGSGLSGALDRFFNRQNAVQHNIVHVTTILARVRSSIYAWALERYHILRFADVPTDAYYRAKSTVDRLLASISPDGLRKFVAAQERALSGSPEEWSQALLSLRRVLKDLADALYPPTDRSIDGHALGEENYVNRLWQFVKEKVAGSGCAILEAEVRYLGQKIDTLHELTCKGTHATVTRTEVNMAVVHIYLLAGDLLSLLPQETLQHLQRGAHAKATGDDTSERGHAKVEVG